MIKVRIEVTIILQTQIFFTTVDIYWHEQHQFHLTSPLTWVSLRTNHSKLCQQYLWQYVLKKKKIAPLTYNWQIYYFKDLLRKLDRSSTIILIFGLSFDFPDKAISPCIWSIRCFRPPSYKKYNHFLQLKLSQSHMLKQTTSIRRQKTLLVLS